MIDATKCQWGLPRPSGYARQCPLAPVETVQVQAADKAAPEPMPLCETHHSQLVARRAGTVYRETVLGNGVPIMVTML
jgi:hypothetical protein